MSSEPVDTAQALEHVAQGGVIRIEQSVDADPLHFRGKPFYIWVRGDTFDTVTMPPYSVRVWTPALKAKPIHYGLYSTLDDVRERIADYLRAGAVTPCGQAATSDDDTIRVILES